MHATKGTQAVRYGRNQARHYETATSTNQTTIRIFAGLNAFDTTAIQLDPVGNMNLVFDVVKLPGWLDYAQYEADIVRFLG